MSLAQVPKPKHIKKDQSINRALRSLLEEKTLRMEVHKGGIGIFKGTIHNNTNNHYITVKSEDWDLEKTTQELPPVPVKITEKSVVTRVGNEKWIKWCGFFGCAILTLSLIQSFLFAIYISFYSSSGNTQFTNTRSSFAEMPRGTVEGANVHSGPMILGRSSWMAQSPVCEPASNTLPVKRVIVRHTATEACSTSPQCVLNIRHIQQFHIESRNWCDIAFNFLVGGDGKVYEGRGWRSAGAHTKNHNNGSIGVAFVGTFTDQLPSRGQMDAFQRLMYVGVSIKKIHHDYALLAQCQLINSSDPGWALAKNMSSWPHYSPNLPLQCTKPKTYPKYKEDL